MRALFFAIDCLTVALFAVLLLAAAVHGLNPQLAMAFRREAERRAREARQRDAMKRQDHNARASMLRGKRLPKNKYGRPLPPVEKISRFVLTGNLHAPKKLVLLSLPRVKWLERAS
jgi:heme exporter protein D